MDLSKGLDLWKGIDSFRKKAGMRILILAVFAMLFGSVYAGPSLGCGHVVDSTAAGCVVSVSKEPSSLDYSAREIASGFVLRRAETAVFEETRFRLGEAEETGYRSSSLSRSLSSLLHFLWVSFLLCLSLLGAFHFLCRAHQAYYLRFYHYPSDIILYIHAQDGFKI